MSAKVFLLKCVTQSYAWGKYGMESEVARLLISSDESSVIDPSMPYAELWMGTHPTGMSVIAESEESLSEWIARNPDTLGRGIHKRLHFPDQLPFLFKVLSVNIALSIQVHPNREEAVHLHSEKPNHYPDANHKPEMAIALTPFQALCGFRPKEEILSYLNNIQELRFVVGDVSACALAVSKSSKTDREGLKKCFTALMTCDEIIVKDQLLSLVARIKQESLLEDSREMEADKTLLRLHQQFPGDVGCFCIYFLNLVTLQPGESIYLAANIPHAYLYGDCLECMACSDNVVRAGLTPKYKDITTLCNMLNYHFMPVEDILFKFQTHIDDPHVTIYNPSADEFTVAKILLSRKVEHYIISPLDGASLLIVISGNADAVNKTLDKCILLKRGSVLFISANEAVNLKIRSGSDDMLMFRAYCIL